MKGYFHFVIALVACALLSVAPAFAKEISKSAPSSARVTLRLNPDGKQRDFDSLSSAFHELQQEGRAGFYGTQVLDYSTFGNKEKLIEAGSAYFLVDADKAKVAGSDFKVVAFASHKAAKDAQTKLGGELRDFDDAWSAVALHWGVDLSPKPQEKPAEKAVEKPQVQREQRRTREPEPAQCFT